MRNAVVFLGMTYPEGIIRHFAFLAVELNKVLCKEWEGDFYFASTDGETNQNAWPMINNAFSMERIIKANRFELLADKICSLTSKYDRVLVHTGGGWGQTKHFVRAQRRMDKMLQARLVFIGTTHSYRNSSFLRIPMSAFQYMLYRLYYRMIIFQCQYAADRFAGGNHLLKIGRGAIIPLGCEEFPSAGVEEPPEIVSQSALAPILLDGNLFKMVYLAQFRPGKMHAWLVNSLLPVLRSHKNIRLLLCGSGAEKVVAKVKEIVERHGLSGQVLMPGQIPRYEVPWLLRHVNCAIVPSRAETFGHNFIEPMFASLPVIGTRVGIGREVIMDGKTGFGFSLKDPRELQKAVASLAENPALAKAMGAEAYAIVSKKFRHADVAMSLADLYKKLLSE